MTRITTSIRNRAVCAALSGSLTAAFILLVPSNAIAASEVKVDTKTLLMQTAGDMNLTPIEQKRFDSEALLEPSAFLNTTAQVDKDKLSKFLKFSCSPPQSFFIVIFCDQIIVQQVVGSYERLGRHRNIS